MARQGRAGPALAIAAVGSFFAGCIGTLLIALFGPPLAEVALKFGAPEYFALMLMALIAAACLAHGDMVKSLAMVFLGLLFGIIGTDVNSGMARYSFGLPELTDGIGFTVVAVGLFAVSEIVKNLESGGEEKQEVFTKDIKHLYPTLADLKASAFPILRGTAVGAFFGALPGTGPAISAFSSYMVEKKMAKDPSRFGKGAIEGVAGPEAANNAAAQTSFIPTLTLGIPGQRHHGPDAGRAHHPGHCPGATGDDIQAGSVLGLDRQHVDRQRTARRPEPAARRHVGETAEDTVPVSLPSDHHVLRRRQLQHQQQRHGRLSLVGIAGILGYVLVKLECEPAPLILGYVLGPLMEENLRRALLISRGDPTVFFTRPISLAFMILSALILVSMILPAIRKKKEQALEEGGG